MTIQQEKKTSFEIKSTQLEALEVYIYSTDLVSLKQSLQQQFPDNKFFDCQPVIINTKAIDESFNSSLLDLAKLITLITSINLQPIGLLTDSLNLQQQAVKLNFPVLEMQFIRSKSKKNPIPKVSTSVKTPTMIIEKPVRAGQRIYAKNTDLIILATVNRGAEVMADGNLYIYAALRGRALAGANGNTDARIFINQLDAELVSIAGFYRTSEIDWPDNLHNQAVQISLTSNKLLFNKLA